jgi:membrane-associated protease RseP (regulator of RpoE activity)
LSGVKRSLLWLLVLAACGVGGAPGMPAGPARPAVEAAQVVEPAALRAAIAAGVRPRGANEASFEVDAFVAALVVEELAAGGGGMNVEPALEGGAQVGYRVLAVAEGSPYARVGLQAGDVIEAIGEVRLDSPGRAAGLLASVQRGANVAVVRGGVGFNLDVRIAGGLAWAELLRTRSGSPQGQVPEDMSQAVAAVEEIAPPPEIPAPSVAGTGRPARPGAATPGIQRPGSSSPGIQRPGGSSTPAPSGPAVASCATASSCTLDRKTFDAAVADPERLSSQVSIAPARGGYKLTRVAANSAIGQLGFRAGDTLISVNGNRLDDDAAALALYMGLGSASKYVVVYERGGVRATKTIALRG